MRRLKIGDEENYRASRHDLVQVIKGQGRFCAPSLRLEKQDLANESQRVRAAFFWWNKKLDAISEKNEPDLIVVPDRAEGEQASDFCGQLAFGLCCAPKIP